jgi:hypothetical protein
MRRKPAAGLPSSPNSTAILVARLAIDLGVSETDAWRAATLLRSGRADLLELVLNGRLSVDHALEIARPRRQGGRR